MAALISRVTSSTDFSRCTYWDGLRRMLACAITGRRAAHTVFRVVRRAADRDVASIERLVPDDEARVARILRRHSVLDASRILNCFPVTHL